MTVNLNLSAEAESRLRERATRTGQRVEDVVRDVVEAHLRTPADDQPARPLPASNETVRNWAEFVHRMSALTRDLPPGHVVDDSRESIYAGREE